MLFHVSLLIIKGEGAHLYKSATLSEMIEKKIFLRTQQSHYKAYKKARGV
jgi:hypothetical protein